MQRRSWLVAALASVLAVTCGKDDSTNPDGDGSDGDGRIEMASIPGGTFQMGSNSAWAYDGEDPVHEVTLSGFCMSKCEVTQVQYQTVMGSNPSHFQGSNRPVEMVSWYDAARFCNALSQCEGLTSFYNDDDLTSQADTVRMDWDTTGYRLPTEAEWEYACRAGTTTDFYSGNEADEYEDPNMDLIGWYVFNSNDQTHDVGGKQPNSFGLYDMSGNVLEWCNDWAGGYSPYAQINPTGLAFGSRRVYRGGCWYYRSRACRSAFRLDAGPSQRSSIVGFRIVR